MKNFDFLSSLMHIEKKLDESSGAYYIYDKILQKAGKDKSFLYKINQNRFFWHTLLYSLQSTYFIGLGRIFDNYSNTYSINQFLNNCIYYKIIFSKNELEKRKAKDISDENKLKEYMKGTYEFSETELKEFQRIIKDYKRYYNKNYEKLRNKVFAHNEIIIEKDLEELFLKASHTKLDEIFSMLTHILIELQNLYYNGHEIKLWNEPYIQKNSFIKIILNDSENVLNHLNG